MAKRRGNNGDDAPITVTYGNHLIDYGMASLPKAFFRFYRFLACDGEQLSDQEAMPLFVLLALFEERNLRLCDLPVRTSEDRLRKYRTKWKRMGLLFTSRIYYTYAEMAEHFKRDPPQNPRIKNINFDLTNMAYNVELVSREWSRRNLELLVEWERDGRKGKRPVYQFPEGYRHEMILCPEVAHRIVAGVYDRGKAGEDFSEEGMKRWFIPPKWWFLACEMAEFAQAPEMRTGSDQPCTEEAGERTGSDRPCTGEMGARTGSDRPCTEMHAQGQIDPVQGAYRVRSTLSLKEEDKDKDDGNISLVLAEFARLKDGADATHPARYQPTARERVQAQQLLDEGYSVGQLTAAIAQAFDSRPPVAKPIQSFGYVLSYVHRRLRPTGQPPTEAGPNADLPTGARATEGVLSAADAAHTPRPTDDPLARVYALLDSASIQGMEGVEDVIYDTPGVRLGLRSLLDRPDPYSPDDIHKAVVATVSRNVHPNGLVGYVSSILENARVEAREREGLHQAIPAATPAGTGGVGLQAARSPPLTPANASSLPSEEARSMWEAALGELEMQMTKATFGTWVKPTVLLSWGSEANGSDNSKARVVLGAPNEYVRDWLENRLITPIQRTLSGIAGHAVEVRFEICGQPEVQQLPLSEGDG